LHRQTETCLILLRHIADIDGFDPRVDVLFILVEDVFSDWGGVGIKKAIVDKNRSSDGLKAVGLKLGKN
jgi:hypothetical protein